jgi:hypothetical protein
MVTDILFDCMWLNYDKNSGTLNGDRYTVDCMWLNYDKKNGTLNGDRYTI